ncbi:hypothetical protein Gogos_011869 [Gossypium gossypioides]|uniref:DUF4283 domain-containing protein n=1 Tax=Gossypium gossypioides TaxID=34282 RepID=A0A7J9BQR6_GOSGO|nr:hypothetical protein [Gossypium gossypioides]
MKETMANLWHPLGEVQISDLDGKRYLFKLFHELDIERVIMSALWTFNNHLLIFHQLKEEKDPMVHLISSAFWIKVHYLPPGFFSKSMAKLFDLMLRANTKRASTMNNVWLREEDDANWECNGCKIQAEDANAGPFNEMDHAIMEDNPIENCDGKKRPKFDNMDLGVSEEDDSPEWRMMAFYGAPDLREKKETSNLLRRLGRYQNHSWIFCGDFNEILLWETSSGNVWERLILLQKGLKTCERKIRMKRRGPVKYLTKKMKSLNNQKRDEENLVNLMEVKLHLNIEIEKEEAF